MAISQPPQLAAQYKATVSLEDVGFVGGVLIVIHNGFWSLIPQERDGLRNGDNSLVGVWIS